MVLLNAMHHMARSCIWRLASRNVPLLYLPVSMDCTLSMEYPPAAKDTHPFANRTISLSLSGDEDSIQ